MVEVQRSADRSAGLADTVEGAKTKLFVFDAALQPFDEDVVAPGLAIHADSNVVAGERDGEDRTIELRTLIGVEDVRLAVTSQTKPRSMHPAAGAASSFDCETSALRRVNVTGALAAFV
jgi:hypothetical protein